MPDEDFENDDTQDDDELSGPAGLRKAKKAAEARNKELEAELAQVADERKELAFLKAGIEDGKMADYFRKTYDGPLTAEAIRSAAVEAGVVPETDQGTADAIHGSNQMAATASGGETQAFGSMTIGPPHARREVPAEQAEMWSEFEASLIRAAKGSAPISASADVLRRHGHSPGVDGTSPMSVGPNTVPLNQQQGDGKIR